MALLLLAGRAGPVLVRSGLSVRRGTFASAVRRRCGVRVFALEWRHLSVSDELGRSPSLGRFRRILLSICPSGSRGLLLVFCLMVGCLPLLGGLGRVGILVGSFRVSVALVLRVRAA